MADDLDQVLVFVGDLRALERVLETAHGLVTADDIARQFRAMSGRPQPSPLARGLNDQLERVREYLSVEPEAREADDGSEATGA